MTVRIGDTVPAHRRRDEERPAEVTETRRRVMFWSTFRKQRPAWHSHLDSPPDKSRT
ncbi:MAG TPA: hypothetical protein VHC18_08540 [Amycolatopsis sp.]|nr:hypothetical protein [Amycolatopsis sp.]